MMPMESVRKMSVKAVSVILRVPGLFIAEAWYRTDPVTIHHQFSNMAKHNVEHPQEIVFHVIYYLAFILSLTLIILPLRRLVQFYMYVLSAALLLATHFISKQFVKTEAVDTENTSIFESQDKMLNLGMYIVVQGLLSAVIAYLINLPNSNKIGLFLLYTAPMLARVAGVETEDLPKVHNGSTFGAVLAVVYFTFNNIPILLDMVKDGIRQLTFAVHLYGWIPFLVALWFKILLPVQFLTFWCVLFALQLYKYLSVVNHPIVAEGWLVVLLAGIGECCVTPMSLMGLCVTVSYLSYIILTLTKFFLQGREAFMNENVMHQGWTEGFTMFLLAIQTGIIDLKAGKRVFLMSVVLFIVVSSLIQSMFEITDPILLTLGASQNKNMLKHTRAIALCTFLWMAPIYMTVVISQVFELDFWLLVVISSCVLTSVQVIGSLTIYALFVYDAIQKTPWDNLDDIVYYAKATTRVLEFVVALFVVCYGVTESLFGEWSFVNSSILFIHCYFNVWQRLQAGWKTYLLRREAAKKIRSLPEATAAELREHNDVCSICFQELRSARVTPCQHYFHAVCLRKWLYVQEYCPLCHSPLTGTEEHRPPQEEAPEAGPGHPPDDSEAPQIDEAGDHDRQSGEQDNPCSCHQSELHRASKNSSTSLDSATPECSCPRDSAGPVARNVDNR